MPDLPRLLSIACALFVVATLLSERVSSSPLAPRLTKAIASLVFVALAGLMLRRNGATGYSQAIFVGLVFGAIGDVALSFSSKRSFVTGLSSFLIGHLAYVLAFADSTSVATWPHPWSLVPLMAVLGIGAALWPFLGKLRPAVLLYLATIALMLVGAVSIWRMHAHPDSLQILVGALCFAVSDIAVAKARFVRKSPTDRLWGLPLYYLGQLLLAWSI